MNRNLLHVCIPAPLGFVPLGVALAYARAIAGPLALPPVKPTGRFGEPWIPSPESPDAIVTTTPIRPDTISNRCSRDLYGGDFVGESMHGEVRDRVLACVNFCAGEEIPVGPTLTEILDLLDRALQGRYIGPGIPFQGDVSEGIRDMLRARRSA